MGLIETGILGGFRKKTGTVVGAQWRGLDVIRAMPRKNNKAPSQKQLEQQQKFGLVTAFLSEISELIDQGYKTADALMPMNKAVAYHIKEAVIGVYPDYSLDLTKILYSVGNVKRPYTVSVNAISDGKVKLIWDRTSQEGKDINPSDVVTVLGYNADKKEFVIERAVTSRGLGEYELQLPQVFNGDTMHLYISFYSMIRKMSSDSIYVGTAIVNF